MCSGKEGGFIFHEEFLKNDKFRKDLVDECNRILDTIPELEGAHVEEYCRPKAESARDFILKNLYYAKYGKVHVRWLSGYIYRYEIADGFTKKPSEAGLEAYFKWYENELRKNGFSDAKISPIRSAPDRIAPVWYFENYSQSRSEIARITNAW